MKKIISLLLIVCMIISLASCGINVQIPEITTESTRSSEATLETEKTTEKPTEPINVNGNTPLDDTNAYRFSPLFKYKDKLYYSSYQPSATYSNEVVFFLPENIKDEAGHFVIVNDKIYYITKSASTGPNVNLNIYRCKLDGTEKELLCSDYSNTNGLNDGIFCNNKIYYMSKSGFTVLDVNTKKSEILSEDREIFSGDIYNNLCYYTIDGVLYTFNFETEKSELHSDSNVGEIIGIDNGYLYYVPWFFNSTRIPVHRLNLENNEDESVESIQTTKMTVYNNTFYYYDDRQPDRATGEQSEYKCIKAHDVNSDTTNILKNFTDYSESDNVYYLEAKYGYLMYVKGDNSPRDVNSHRYIIDLQSKEETLISDYWTSSF